MSTFRAAALLGALRSKGAPVPWLVHGGRVRRICVVASLALLLASTLQVAFGRAGGLPDGVAVRIDEVVFSEQELADRLDLVEVLYGIRSPESARERDAFLRDAAKAVAVSEVIHDAAADEGVRVTRADAQDALDAMVEAQVSGGRAAFLQYLEGQGVSESDVLDEVERQLTTTRLFEKVTASVEPVTDPEITREFEKRRAEMVSPEQREISNIVVASEADAQRILDAIRQGASFAKVARRYSLDEATRDAGGALGKMTIDQLEPAYADAAFSARVGAAFGPVRTEYGWNVGQVLEVAPPKAIAREDAHAQLRAQLTGEKQAEKWRSWLGKRIQESDVEYASRYQPEEPDSPPSFDPVTETPSLEKGGKP